MGEQHGCPVHPDYWGWIFETRPLHLGFLSLLDVRVDMPRRLNVGFFSGRVVPETLLDSFLVDWGVDRWRHNPFFGGIPCTTGT